MESNPTQRSLCKAKNSAENVTLVDGIGAGNFTDLGHVADMNDCVSRCCANSACELAFRIEDDCYGVTCHSERSCRTRSARNSMSLRPMIAIVRDVGSRQGKLINLSLRPPSRSPAEACFEIVGYGCNITVHHIRNHPNHFHSFSIVAHLTSKRLCRL